MKTKLVSTLIAGCIVIGSLNVQAQEKPAAPPATTAAEEEAKVMALAKASQNPVADLNTIPIQFNWFTGGGLGDQSLSQTNFQPVLPLEINEHINVVSRTVVPIMSVPTGGGEKVKGIADIQEQLYFSPSHPKGLIWGIGPIINFPTSTISEISTGQFALGPTAVLLAMPGKFVVGLIANQMWRIGGSDVTTPINAFYTQPFINYNLKLGWSISTAPGITANWNAASGQEWTVPVGIGVSKITKVGNQAMNVSLQYYHNAVRPDNAGADQVRMVVALLFPRKA